METWKSSRHYTLLHTSLYTITYVIIHYYIRHPKQWNWKVRRVFKNVKLFSAITSNNNLCFFRSLPISCVHLWLDGASGPARIIFFWGGGRKIGYVIKKWRHIYMWVGGACPARKSLNFGSLIRHLLHLNHIFNCEQGRKSLMLIFKKYFGPNLMPRNPNIKNVS